MIRPIVATAAAAAGLLLQVACGGSNAAPGAGPAPPPPVAATVLAYADPTEVPASAYVLRRNSALSSPGSHLVLDLYGPAATVTGSGVVLTLEVDPAKAAWASVAGNALVANGSVFAANGNGAPIIEARRQGGTLQVLVSERGVTSPKPLSGPLLQIALDLNPGQAVGGSVALTPQLAKSQVLLGTRVPLSDLRMGTLTLGP